MPERHRLVDELGALLEVRGMSRSQLARRADLSHQTVNKWLAHDDPREPLVCHLDQAFHALGYQLTIEPLAPAVDDGT